MDNFSLTQKNNKQALQWPVFNDAIQSCFNQVNLQLIFNH